MTNEAFVFNSTNRERAILRRSAMHKKNGSKSKSCKLEVDRMSQKQIAKKHGPVESWKLTNFYSYVEFKKMPDDIKVKYINYLMDKYEVGISNISKDLFGMSKTTLSDYLDCKHLTEKIHRRKKGSKPRLNDVERFRDDILKFWEGPKDEKELEKPYKEMAIDCVDDASTAPSKPVLAKEFKMEDADHSETEKSEASDPIPLSMAFSTSYISKGLDLNMIPGIAAMFEGKMVHVTIEVSIL